MPQARKTRQQKIQQSQRSKTQQVTQVQESGVEPVEAVSVMPMSHSQEIAETQRYVVDELRRIGWISLVCGAILAVATIFLADFGWAEAIRNWLPF